MASKFRLIAAAAGNLVSWRSVAAIRRGSFPPTHTLAGELHESFADRRQLLRQGLQFNLFARLQLFVA